LHIHSQAQDVTLDSCRHLDAVDFYIRLHSCEYPLLIDVRTFEEFRRERIPGAILVESRAGLEKMADSLDREQPLFLYCEDDHRSRVACKILAGRGFRDVSNLRGGLASWKAFRYELDRKKIKKDKRKS